METSQGKTVRIFLTEGQPTGIRTAEIINWTGKIVFAPRSKLSKLTHRPEVRRSGVYVLVGNDSDSIYQEKVYIGSSDDVWERLKQHNAPNSDKDFWENTIIIISKDENLTKSHILYLESSLIKITRAVRRAVLANGNEPKSNLPESDIADMEYFLDQVKILLPVLGFSFAREIPQRIPEKKLVKSEAISDFQNPIFELEVNGVKAYGMDIDGEFVVLKDSTVRKQYAPSLIQSHRDVREQMVQEKKLVDAENPDFWKFSENVPFRTSSTAANIVTGTRLNGRSSWKNPVTRQTYAEWQESLIREAEAEGETQMNLLE